ncbi:MAG: hypothetical protein J0651_00350 [Actinobacteria bacterium]|nr:hypothetical protein [Actinomycetota bacterium]
MGDNSLALDKAVQESCVLLLTDEGIPELDAADKLMEKAQTLEEKADLAEERSTYAVELGSPDWSSAYKKAASELKRKRLKNYCRRCPGRSQAATARSGGNVPERCGAGERRGKL